MKRASLFFRNHLFGLLCLMLALSACHDEEFQPRNRGYFRFELPKHSYQKFSEPGFPFYFEYPVYGTTVKDTLFFDKKPENPYWMNVEFPQWGGKIYLTYKAIPNQDGYYKMLNDVYRMTSTHEKKADYIKDPVINIPQKKMHGLIFDVGGNAASALQFYVTDSTKHFLRGALYFDVTPNADSLKPVNAFMREDVIHLINSLEWTR
jgi:gliding motility-associated lipoprotein GldD